MSDVVTEVVTTVEPLTEFVSDTVVESIHTVDVLTVSEPEVIVESESLIEILETKSVEILTETQEVVTVLTEGTQGPPGPPGIVEEDIVYAKRLDMISADVFYKGEAAVGSMPGAPVWRIRRVTMTTIGELVDMSEQWADGAADFVHKWDDRASLIYV